MAKCSQVARGARARDKGVTFTGIHGEEHRIDLAILSGNDEEEIISRATKYSRSKDAIAKRGEAFFDFNCHCEAIAIFAIDPDSAEDKPERYFKDANEVREVLDRDRVVYLIERQGRFQEKISPLKHELSQEDYQQRIYRLASAEVDSNDDPFSDCAPGLRLNCMRTLAKTHIASLMLKLSSIGEQSSAASKTTTSSGTDGSGTTS